MGNSPLRHPVENVAALVSRLRTSLGAGSVVGGRSGYRIGDQFQVDLHHGGSLVTVACRQLVSGRPLTADPVLLREIATELAAVLASTKTCPHASYHSVHELGVHPSRAARDLHVAILQGRLSLDRDA